MDVCFKSPHLYIKLPRKVVDNLKCVSDLSTKNKWEYAGYVDVSFEDNKYKFNDTVYVTSKDRRQVKLEKVRLVWPSLFTFHTHPSITKPKCEKGQIFTTLPSDADFEAFIKGYPEMQSNVICDAHGYYLIDIIKSADKNKLPVPEMVSSEMKEMRKRPFLLDCVFSEEGGEYHQTTLKEWKHFINYDVHYRLNSKFGITIRYYGYNEEPATIVLEHV